MNIERLKPEKPRAFALSSLIVITVVIFGFFGYPYWHEAYEISPFRAIFGTGLFFIVMLGPVVVGSYNLKMFKLKRRRVRILEKINDIREAEK